MASSEWSEEELRLALGFAPNAWAPWREIDFPEPGVIEFHDASEDSGFYSEALRLRLVALGFTVLIVHVLDFHCATCYPELCSCPLGLRQLRRLGIDAVIRVVPPTDAA